MIYSATWFQVYSQSCQLFCTIVDFWKLLRLVLWALPAYEECVYSVVLGVGCFAEVLALLI